MVGGDEGCATFLQHSSEKGFMKGLEPLSRYGEKIGHAKLSGEGLTGSDGGRP